MKKFNLLLIAILLLTLAGCQVQSPVNKNATNGNGSIAVNVQSDSPIPSEPETPGLTADASAPLPANPPAFDSGDTKPVASGDILEIKEKMFVAQTNDIYYNAEDYLGKTLKYEGLFTVYTDPETDVTYYSVI
ncbi:MAG: hypothetical protein LBT32_02365, partial [Peptococcaceae bacterium]|nr:hypothetical protein [Peptococcaceae bacterium]